MMKALHHLLAAIAVVAVGLSFTAQGASYSTDQSDLWWVPSESGWGIQFVQRNSTIFATMFVYDTSGAPTWYAAAMDAHGFTWTGDLYAARGPWFGTVPFDPTSVAGTKVGTMTWSAATVNTGTLTYTVNGTQISKSLMRESIGLDDYSGDYGGNMHTVNSGCSDPTHNGTSDSPAATALRQGTGGGITLATADPSQKVCSYNGTITQLGQMGNSAGTFSCSDGETGSFNIYELQVNISGITWRFVTHASKSGCTATGWFGAGRGTTF
jgi:hypothetical protein